MFWKYRGSRRGCRFLLLLPTIGKVGGWVGLIGGYGRGGMDDQTLLDAVNAQILALLSGGAVEEWREGAHQVRHMPIDKLYTLKQTLENNIAAAGGGCVYRVVEGNI